MIVSSQGLPVHARRAMLKGAFIGLGIALLGFLPPILHFVTGPLGPLIGGFVGGSKARATPEKALGIGVLMGILAVAPVFLLLALLSLFLDIFAGEGFGPPLVLGAVVVAWVGTLGAFGALFGGYLSRRATPSQSTTRLFSR